MRKFIQNFKTEYTEKIAALLKKNKSFTVSGITNCAKLTILAQLLIANDKKILFTTETEQSALKFKNDLKKLFDINADIFPYQDGSIYDTNPKNLYKYTKQINILLNNSKIIIVPQKADYF